jgi:hypothetical protein
MIHDILRFPRRISEVLDDLHVAVEAARDFTNRPPTSQREAALKSQVERQLEHIRKLESRRDSRIEELTARIAELESEAKKHADQVAAWKTEEGRWVEETEAYRFKIAELESQEQQVANTLGEQDRILRGIIADLESQLLTARDSLDCANNQITELQSQPLPWRPIGEFDEENCDACVIFMRGNTHKTVEFPGEDGAPRDATHFLYLDGPVPAKPEPKVVAWAVVTENGTLHHHDSYPLVWTSTDPLAESNCQEFCDRKNLIGKYRAVRLAIVEE